MIQILFGGFMGAALLYALIQGAGEQVVAAMLSGAEEAVTTALSLAGGFAFFCGLIAILRRAGAVGWLSRHLAPGLKRLLGEEVPGDVLENVTMNLTANMLGLGNAATPMGIAAAQGLARAGRATNALCLFLVVNASSVQLLPTTVIALRAAAGSASPGAIAGPALAASLVSTLAGILSCKLMEGRE